MPSSPLSPLIDQEYSSVYAYAGVAAIKPRLAEQGAIVVLSEDETFLGVLTPTDVLLHAHHLVIDCLRDKPTLYSNQSMEEAAALMVTSGESVLAVVYHHGKLAGLLHQRSLMQHLIKENHRLMEICSTMPPLR